MSDTTLNQFLASGTHAERLAFTPTPPTPAAGPDPGYIFFETDTGLAFAWNGVAWVAMGGGTVTNTGTITDHAVVVGNGGSDISALASLGTTGFVLTSAGAGADPAFATPVFTKIEQQTPSGVGTITFSSLGSFTHLEILYSARSTKAAVTSENFFIRFNADTGANYDTELIYNNAATTTAAFEALASTSGTIAEIPAATATANRAGGGSIKIFDYRGTTFNKTVTADNHLASATTTGSLFNRFWGVTWRSTAAITSITLFLASGNFVAGSTFSLYGLS